MIWQSVLDVVEEHSQEGPERIADALEAMIDSLGERERAYLATLGVQTLALVLGTKPQPPV